VLALGFFAGSDGASMADDSGLAADARSTQSTKRPAASGSKETGGAAHRKTLGTGDQGPTKPARPLTVQQKRLFVLGLGAREKK
jgi:hypothetical protein